MQLSTKTFYWLNFVWFQAIWFYAVIYTGQAIPLMLLSLCCHFLLSPTRFSDLINVVTIMPIGCLADYILTYMGIFTFDDDFFIPVWLMLLWAHFAVTLNHGMNWLDKLPVYLCSLFGGVFGALSYYGGAKLGAVVLDSHLMLSLFALAVIWATLLPVYTLLASLNRMCGHDDIKGSSHSN